MLSAAADEDLVEDFSTVSPWERFCGGIEAALREWHLDDGGQPQLHRADGDASYLKVDIDLEWSVGCVESFRLVLDLASPDASASRGGRAGTAAARTAAARAAVPA